jgi:sensor histidine kinase YesM
MNASGTGFFRGWGAESFRSLTWGRLGLFCAFCAWIALYSFPTANAVAKWNGLEPVVRAFFMLFAVDLASYGPVLLAIVAIVNRESLRASAKILLLVFAIVIGGSWSALVATIVFSDIFGSGWNVQAFLNVSYQASIELGLIGATIMLLANRDRANAQLDQEELDRIGLDRELDEARLQMLQSQIEPHFLFNTLANIRRLLQTDPTAGTAMLHAFSAYVEPRLPALRDARSSLGRELALTCAYLNVQQIRMGSRLAVRLSVPRALESAAFPPMMLMTLVENALKHGLAPLPQGGSVAIVAARTNDRLTVEVIDSGVGLRRPTGSGIGIANTRSRLRAMFGGDARLCVADNSAGGVTAAIEVPFSTFETAVKVA